MAFFNLIPGVYEYESWVRVRLRKIRTRIHCRTRVGLLRHWYTGISQPKKLTVLPTLLVRDIMHSTERKSPQESFSSTRSPLKIISTTQPLSGQLALRSLMELWFGNHWVLNCRSSGLVVTHVGAFWGHEWHKLGHKPQTVIWAYRLRYF